VDAERRRRRAFDVDAAVVRAAALRPDGALLAVSDYEGQTSLWDVASGKRAANQPAQSQSTVVYGLAFDPTGQHLAMARQGGAVAL